MTTDEAEEREGEEAPRRRRYTAKKNAVLGAFQVTCHGTACNFTVARIYIGGRFSSSSSSSSSTSFGCRFW